MICAAMTRRRFLTELAKTLLVPTTVMGAARTPARSSELVTLFLCGDVMTGRGVDQILRYPSVPGIHEQYMRSARGYVALAEKKNGRITTPVDFAYIWGEAFAEFERAKPDVRIINLETSVTTSDEWVSKGINYRMHPDNIACLTAAKIDCCALANNHVLDWGEAGLIETLETLEGVGVNSAGAGRDLEEAGAPAILKVGGTGRVIVFAFGTVTSGIPPGWAASKSRPGVNLLQKLSDCEIQRIAGKVDAVKRRGDVVVASVHWGSNWGYRIEPVQRAFAHKLLDEAGVDIIHGHSSHHPKGIEVYNGKPILYGCGDFINDYEGISGHEEYRGELVLMYFVTLNAFTRELIRLEMNALKLERFRLNRVSREDAQWLRDTLDREGAALGTRLRLDADNTLVLQWN